jgi:hypothetical protein
MAADLKCLSISVVAALFLLPGVCFAEVMDKELSLPTIWTEAGALAVAGYFLGRYRIWAAIPVLVFAALLALDQSSELTDLYVGPEIAREAGRSYLVQSYAASAIGLLGPIVGIFGRYMRNSRRRATAKI